MPEARALATRPPPAGARVVLAVVLAALLAGAASAQEPAEPTEAAPADGQAAPPTEDQAAPPVEDEAEAPAEGEAAPPGIQAAPADDPVESEASSPQILVDGIAAQVGPDIVLISEVRALSAPLEDRMRAAGAPPAEMAKIRADALESLIERTLIKQAVRRAELGASDEEVDMAIEAIASENGLSASQLRRSVESQGLPFEVYRDKIKEEIEHTKALNGMVGSRVKVEESEVMALYYEEFAEQPAGGAELHLRHLLIAKKVDEPGALDAVCSQTAAARRRIVSGGEDFAAVAAEVSDANAARGGDIGWVHEDTLAGWMAPAVEGLEPGGVSEVLRMPFGCNLLQVVERRGYERVEYEDVQQALYQRVHQEKMNEEYVEFMDQLREKTYIDRKGVFRYQTDVSKAEPGETRF